MNCFSQSLVFWPLAEIISGCPSCVGLWPLMTGIFPRACSWYWSLSQVWVALVSVGFAVGGEGFRGAAVLCQSSCKPQDWWH